MTLCLCSKQKIKARESLVGQKTKLCSGSRWAGGRSQPDSTCIPASSHEAGAARGVARGTAHLQRSQVLWFTQISWGNNFIGLKNWIQEIFHRIENPDLDYNLNWICTSSVALEWQFSGFTEFDFIGLKNEFWTILHKNQDWESWVRLQSELKLQFKWALEWQFSGFTELGCDTFSLDLLTIPGVQQLGKTGTGVGQVVLSPEPSTTILVKNWVFSLKMYLFVRENLGSRR